MPIILFFASNILYQIKEEGSSINVLVGILLIQFANASATLGGSFFVNKFGQKPTLVWGIFLLILCWVAIIIGSVLKESYVTLAFMILYTMVFQMTLAPIGFCHILETCHPSLIGFHYFMILSHIIVISFLGTWIRTTFGNTVLFSFFCIIMIFGFIYTGCVTRNTSFKMVDGKKVPLTLAEK